MVELKVKPRDREIYKIMGAYLNPMSGKRYRIVRRIGSCPEGSYKVAPFYIEEKGPRQGRYHHWTNAESLQDALEALGVKEPS